MQKILLFIYTEYLSYTKILIANSIKHENQTTPQNVIQKNKNKKTNTYSNKQYKHSLKKKKKIKKTGKS